MTSKTNPHPSPDRVEELKPCPFCASGDLNERTRMEPWGENGSELYQGYVDCEMCGAQGPPTPWYDSHDHALSKLREMLSDDGWNTRPESESVTVMREALELIQNTYGPPCEQCSQNSSIATEALTRIGCSE